MKLEECGFYGNLKYMLKAWLINLWLCGRKQKKFAKKYLCV